MLPALGSTCNILKPVSLFWNPAACRATSPLPDSLYEQDETVAIDSSATASDSLMARQASAVPLSEEEEEASATLDSTATRYTSHIYQPYFTIIPNLLGNDGYFDYYRSKGFRAFSRWSHSSRNLSLEVGYNNEDHRSLPTTTAYDLRGKSDNYRSNPAIDEGRMHTVDVVAGYNLNEEYNFGVAGQKYIRFEIEHSSGALGSDFDFTRYETRLSWTFPTFYQRRLFPNTLDIGLKAGTSAGTSPIRRWASSTGPSGF